MSVAVVSRVMNDGTGPVAAATRTRVVSAIDRLGYRPRAAARELQLGATTTIGLLLADLTNPFFARLADRVVQQARAKGVQILLATTQEDPHLEADAIDTLLSRNVGSVIATPTGGNIDQWTRLIDRGVHVVFVDRELDALPGIDVVSIDNAGAAEVATDHLLALGHRRIAIISGPESTSTGRARVAGFRAAMDRAGATVGDGWIRPVPFRGGSGGDAVTALLSLPNAPTALIVGNTAQVPSVLARVQQSRVRVPDQLSLIVFDDNPWAELVSPPLSVVRQPIGLLALHSMDLAIGRTRKSLPENPRRVVVTGEFVERSSTVRH